MERREFQAGDLIFREGDPNAFACRVLFGEVELMTQVDGRAVVVGTVGEGEFLGEKGVLEGRSRTVTARARTNVTAVVFGQLEYLDWIRENLEPGVSPSDTDEGGASSGNGWAHRHGAEKGESVEYRITLYPMSETLRSSIPSEGMVVRTLPFTIGAAPGEEERPSIVVDLPLTNTHPSRLSPRHFSLERTAGGVLVRDLDSLLGTAVNGEFLGRHFGKNNKVLELGENIIVAGGVRSPFAFAIVVQVVTASGAPFLVPQIGPTKEDLRWQRLREQVVERARAEAWMRIEAETLHRLRLGKLPEPGGVSARTLEAMGGIALGSFFGTLSVLMIFVVFVLFLHTRIPLLF